jgi:hypothetical protein
MAFKCRYSKVNEIAAWIATTTNAIEAATRGVPRSMYATGKSSAALKMSRLHMTGVGFGPEMRLDVPPTLAPGDAKFVWRLQGDTGPYTNSALRVAAAA